MTMIADIFMIAGSLAAGFYCFVLSRRLRRFTDLEKGVGGAVAALSLRVDDLTKTLTRAQTTAKSSVETLDSVSTRAEAAGQKLELLVASLHDLPEPEPEVTRENSSALFVRRSQSLGMN
ncbi:hypothetical protein CLV80_10599 [Yoonia maritima]|uniref:Uncharacterized protein n=1 Tax=Yoonia maritima TaxID=1435347 RepID=A0A2T0VZ78_9RHOB|nr:hypothetical protein [Yoonia maritima]PRY77616.1 hypothetical protein CLV80_10599 [Yoonia maritima]